MAHEYDNSQVLEKHHQIFIEQTPTAIAMLDNDMVYLAVSQRWLNDYKLDEQDVIGRSHYDVFPEIGDDWKKDHQECLKGAINICEEAPLYRADGTTQWIYWDVRPWYNAEGNIGGLLMHTGDITERKERELEKKRFETILSDCSDIARIGTWEINTHTNEIIWSDILYEIHDVSKDFKPSLDSLLEFIEEEGKRDFLEKCMLDLLEKGKEMDEEFEIRTSKGNLKFIKAIGKIEYVDGLVTRVFGIVQDITQIKESERELNKAYNELDAIFSSSSIAVISTDKDGVINRFNSGAEHLLGYSAKEMIGIKKPEIYLFEEELNVFKKDMELEFKGDSNDADFNYRNEKIFNTRQWTFKRKDGSTFPGLKSLTAIQDKDGLNDGFIAVVTDISKIKEVKDELRKKNELLNFAEQITMMGNWKWNVITNDVKWSNNLYSIFDFDSEQSELNYDTYFSFVHPEDKEMVTQHVETAIKIKKFENLVHRIMLEDGTVKTIKLMSEIFTNNIGEVIELFGTCQDITESKKAEQKIIEAKEELEIVARKLSYQNRQLADFTHITSHNLRAPVANLNSLMEIYKLTEDEEERLDVFQKFDTVIDRLTLTLNTLIEALKTKINDTNEELESIDLNETLDSTIQTLSGSILTSNAIIKGDFTEVSIINYNRIYMDSIFLNLIGNAIKYKAKDRAPEIIVKSKVKNGRNNITFKDNGLGINLERHGHKLFGLNKVFHRHPDAKGVGLFLTKTQVEAMGGTITATSEVNVGTTFTIIL